MKAPIVLLTGARAPAALEWARQFAAAGWRVLAADSMPRPLASWSHSVTRTWRVPPARQDAAGFVREVAAVCREENVDLVMPVCEEIFALARGRAALPAGTRLWTEGFDRLRRLHDKGAFMEWAGQLGLPVPETRRVTDSGAVRELRGDWFLKPCYSRFAVEGARWRGATGKDGQREERWLSRQRISPDRAWVAQEFLSGQGWCAYALAEAGRVLSLVCYPVEWTAGAGACVAFAASHHAGVEAWVTRFAGAASLTGQMAFDFIEVPGRGVLPLECNPRATSGLHLLPQAASVLTAALAGRTGPFAPVQPPEGFPLTGLLTVPLLLYGLPQAVRRGAAAEWLQTWSSGREVTSAPGDRAPAFLGNLWTMTWFAREAWRLRCGLTAATTADLEWNGDCDMPSLPA